MKHQLKKKKRILKKTTHNTQSFYTVSQINIDSPYVAKAVLTSESIIFVLFNFLMTTEIKAVCVFKRSKIYKHRAQGSQSHKCCFPEGIYLGEVTEVLLSSGAEGTRMKS